MNDRSSDEIMPGPLAYFLTWSTYGTWLPGDERGWVEYRNGWNAPDPILKRESESRMKENACILDTEQRMIVETTIEEHCDYRGWRLYVVNCRSNHVHVVVSASASPNEVREQLKAWTSRRLKEHAINHTSDTSRHLYVRSKWWAERGSARWINDDEGLETVVQYVRVAQDHPEKKAIKRQSGH